MDTITCVVVKDRKDSKGLVFHALIVNIKSVKYILNMICIKL